MLRARGVRPEHEAGRALSAGPILVAGEALVDLALDEGGTLAAHPGGGPYNTARTAARLEQPAAYLGRLSSDRLGARLRAELAADGVLLDAVVDTDDPTTLALAELDVAGAAAYRFYTEGTSAAGLTEAAVDAALAALAAAPGYLHAGTLGLVLEPMAGAVAALVSSMADAGALVMVDPNSRPAATPDRDAYWARLQGVLERTDIVKVSDDDLAWLVPGRAVADAAASLLDLGPVVVLLTRGAKGVTVLMRDGAAFDVAAPPVKVADTIGAGDAFSGGFLAWWRGSGLDRSAVGDRGALEGAARFACVVAAKTCERPGASPPWLREVAGFASW